MGTLLIQDGIGGYIPLAGPTVDGEGPVGHAVRMRRLAAAGIPADLLARIEPAEGETMSEAQERMARLRVARNDPKWDCPRCGAKGAKWAHEDFPALCKQVARCTECGAEFHHQVPESCPLCGTPIFITTQKGQS